MIERKSMYISLYHFQLRNAVMEGKEVYMLDKGEMTVSHVNSLKLSELIEIGGIIEAEGDERFYFWYVEVENE